MDSSCISSNNNNDMLAAVHEEESSIRNPPSSSKSKVASIKKKFRFFRKKKNRDSFRTRESSSLNGSSHGSLGEQEVRTGGKAHRNSSVSSISSQESDDVLLVDKFGFTFDPNATDEAENDSSAISNVRSNDNRKVGSKNSNCSMMKKFARNGLPDANMRHRAWVIITGIDAIILQREGEYDAMVSKSRADMNQIQDCLIGGHHRTEWGLIEKDIKRTFPDHHMFKDIEDSDTVSTSDCFLTQRGKARYDQDEVSQEEFMDMLGKISGRSTLEEGYGKKALRRVLRAYSVYDPEIGYCQGMNFLAGMFLTFLPEEKAFWMLVVIMNEDPYKLRELFSKDMTGTHEVGYIADNLIAQFLPKLYEHLENEQVHISMFVTQWLMTIFTSTFPFKLVARVWDSFLCDGWSVVYQTMIALLEHIQEELLSRNFEQILNYSRGFQSTVDSECIIAAFPKIPLEQHHIQDYAKQFRRLKESGEIQVEEILQRRVRSPESTDGYSVSSAGRSTMHNINKVHRFVAKLKRSTREISVEDLSPKLISVVGSAKFAVVLSNLLSPEECEGLIKRAKFEQFEDVHMKKKTGNSVTDVASCRRSLLEDLDLASELFNRLTGALEGTDLEIKLHHAPWISDGDASALNATGLNDRLHILRYGVGQFFAPHRDSRYRDGTETSHISMQVFLNNNFSGGKTSFRGGKRFLDVKPKAGSALLFDQDLRREECEVLHGRKFIVRSDVMFGPV